MFGLGWACLVKEQLLPYVHHLLPAVVHYCNLREWIQRMQKSIQKSVCACASAHRNRNVTAAKYATNHANAKMGPLQVGVGFRDQVQMTKQ